MDAFTSVFVISPRILATGYVARAVHGRVADEKRELGPGSVWCGLWPRAARRIARRSPASVNAPI